MKRDRRCDTVAREAVTTSCRWLSEMRELVKKLKRELKDCPYGIDLSLRREDVSRLCTLVTAMDNSLKSSNGLEALPVDWRPRVIVPRRSRRSLAR